MEHNGLSGRPRDDDSGSRDGEEPPLKRLRWDESDGEDDAAPFVFESDADGSDDDDEEEETWEEVAVPPAPAPEAPAVAASDSAPTDGAAPPSSDSDSDDEPMDWAPVGFPINPLPPPAAPVPESNVGAEGLQIVLDIAPEDADGTAKKPKRRAITKADRLERLALHRAHLLALLATAHYGKWATESPLVHAVLASMLPESVLARSGVDASGPAQQVRLRPLIVWFRETFTADPWCAYPTDSDVMDPERPSVPVGALLDAAEARRGHHDTLTLLFAALLCHLRVPHRLAVGLAPVPLSFEGELRLPTEDGEASASGDGRVTPESTARPREVLAAKSSGRYPLSFVIERPTGDDPPQWVPLHLHHVAASEAGGPRPYRVPPLPTAKSAATPPLASFIAGFGTRGPAYVVALVPPAGDGAIRLHGLRDVSVRYLTGGRKVEDKKRRVPLDDAWWLRVCRSRDEARAPTPAGAAGAAPSTAGASSSASASLVEDQQLLEQLLKAPLPTRLGDYKDHRLYALERHLKRSEVIHPKTPVLGKIKGEPIYPRTNVHTVRSREAWLRNDGLAVKDGEEPVAMAKGRGPEGKEQPLFGAWQTTAYESAAVDPNTGEVPKNQFGNVELFHPRMLPRGGVHVTFKGAKQLARHLGIDFADAVVGFDFKRGGLTVPAIHGIVVAEYAVPLLREASANLAAVEAEEALAERSRRAIQRWGKFAFMLMSRQRVQNLFSMTGAMPSVISSAAVAAGQREAGGVDEDSMEVEEEPPADAGSTSDDSASEAEVPPSSSSDESEDDGEEDFDDPDLGPRVRRQRGPAGRRAAPARAPSDDDDDLGGGFML
ncbi:hypothetical protein H9P43_001647 [Blastocladiella emersonii ATCC 22665]|nr:hypothetical protein H9P43_001647 [Blastocladiella emersonii ATCC 22665]